MGQELWDFVDGSEGQPREDKGNEKEVKQWQKNNAKVMSWNVSSVEPQIRINLRAHTTAASMWSFFKEVISSRQ